MEIPESFKPKKKDLEKEAKRLLEEGPKIIGKDEELEEKVLYGEIVYGNLTFEEFSKCNYPQKKLKALKVSFKHKKLSFEATHHPSDMRKSTSVYLKLFLDHPKLKIFDRLTLSSVLMKYKFYYTPTPKPKRTVYKRVHNKSEYLYSIKLPSVVFCKLEINRDIKGLYQKHFKDVHLEATYVSITNHEYDYAMLPVIKIKSRDGIQILV